MDSLPSAVISDGSSSSKMISDQQFGTDLISLGILPVNLIVSNSGDQRFELRPSDILLRRGSLLIDPIPLERIKEAVKLTGRYSEKTEIKIDKYLSGLSFSETILGPHDTYSGVVFFHTDTEEREKNRAFRILRIFKEGNLRLQVAIANYHTDERIHFGPFSLSQ